jgi:hypothetical protein
MRGGDCRDVVDMLVMLLILQDIVFLIASSTPHVSKVCLKSRFPTSSA